ncbi:MAG: cytochrome c3 family protein [bacterium]
MKKLALVAVVVAVVAMMAMGVYASDVRNTKHNLSTWGTGDYKSTNYSEICVFCHTPHAAGQEPLWNRNMTGVTGFTTYSSTTFDVTAADIDATSKLCFSCHLATNSAAASLNNPSNLNSNDQPTFNFNGIRHTAALGTNLRDDHPVAFDYNAVVSLNKYELNTKASVEAVLGSDTFAGGQMTCASCHDVHGKGSGSNLVPVLLRRSNASSMLCLTCHTK